MAVFDPIQGQGPALGVLRHALAQQQLGGAYLFAGPSGVGKQRAAIALAQAASCAAQPGVGCGDCEVCRRIGEGTHPDVRVFAPRDEGNRNIPIDYLRSEVLPLTKFAPFEAADAFLIFPQADVSFPVQHAEAANALLKTLEEPRAKLHFILLSERPDRLLPTIRSRCQRVRFAPLSRALLAAILDAHGAPEASRDAAIAMAGGRADRALALCGDERAAQLLSWVARIDLALERGQAVELIEVGEQLAGDPARGLVLDALSAYYRDVAVEALAAGPAELVASGRDPVLAERAGRVTPGTAAHRVARIAEFGEDLERNANPQLALEGMLFELARAAP